MNESDYKTWFFDCDGVLLDSISLKTEAFYEVALPYGKEAAKALASYHEQVGGVSRFEKFRYFFEIILEKKDFQSEYEKTLTRFSEVTRQKMIDCPETKGMRDLLSILKRTCSCYVISGGAQSELRDVFSQKGLADCFVGIYGSPDNKIEILEKIYQPEQDRLAVFVGDSRYDYEAASAYGIDFIFMSAYTELNDWQSYFQDKPHVRIIGDLSELAREL